MSSQQGRSHDRDGSALSDKIATSFGIDRDVAQSAIAEIENRLGFNIQRAMLSRGGIADLVTVLTGTQGAAQSKDAAIAHGNDVLGVLVGSKHASRGIAQKVARSSGVDIETAKQLLPIVADSMVAKLQRQAEPQLARLLKENPSLAAASRGSPLPLPGELPEPDQGPAGNWGGTSNGSGTSKPKIGGSPLPIPGDNIPGVGRSRPQADNPFENLPDIVRRGGAKVPNGGGGGGSLEDIIRSILSSVLGVQNGGIIGNMIRLFLVRFLVNLVRRFLGRMVGGR